MSYNKKAASSTGSFLRSSCRSFEHENLITHLLLHEAGKFFVLACMLCYFMTLNLQEETVQEVLRLDIISS